MTIDLFIPILRQFLQVLGGYLIAQGILETEIMDTFTGLFINGVVFGWWLIDHARLNRKQKIIE